jgi:transposase InsO family protein
MPRKPSEPPDEHERNTQIALFRYGLIAQLVFAPLGAGQLEQALRQIASQRYTIPYSKRTRVGISTLRRYLEQYQTGGFDALRPKERADKGVPRALPGEVLERAIALRLQQPARTTPMLVELLQRDPQLHLEVPLNAHTLTTHLRQRGKTRRLLAQSARAFHRFEQDAVNALWQGDAMVGPWLPDPQQPGKKKRAHLFCFLDDHSRLVPHAEFFWEEALPRLERVLKVGILKRGLPKALYVDNGQVYHATQFAAACASLGVECKHAAPYSPQAKGKQERFFATVRLQFLPEVETSAIATLSDLNESFWAWLELVYHRAVHSETGQSPLERYQAGIANVRQADGETLRKAFLWREKRRVRKDGRVELQGNTYRVDPQFIGRQIELRFDPFDLAVLEVWLDGNCFGKAQVVQQGREQHIAVERLTTPTPSASAQPKTSLDYLAVLRAEYQQRLRQQAGTLRFSQLPPEEK